MENRPPPNIRPAGAGIDRVVVVVVAGLAEAGSSIIRSRGENAVQVLDDL